MSLDTQPETELKLDFDDLVKELDAFEQEAVELQSRISNFMAAATEAARGPESDNSDDSAGSEDDSGTERSDLANAAD